MKKAELILVPTPDVGHLITIREFAKCLINSDDRISVTTLSMKWSSGLVDDYTESLATYTKSLVTSQPD
ncbi:hypothetical protein F3Y22_tig00000715pilonHSYRG00087 [Hibiscus syriacus]|uniref:Uncharacterized protein n=1 Tax=Hibiscus syriacus TaxID=106335 RepID=A0A6A3D4F8_HIBSY|nr:hypothetical protein F3Y22_tig00000715pilonHSYRG00087 [Hibiscus syriacus]